MKTQIISILSVLCLSLCIACSQPQPDPMANVRSGQWCYSDAYLEQWQQSWITRRIQECLDAGPARRVHCMESCNEIESYSFMMPPGHKLDVCLTRGGPSDPAFLECIRMYMLDCIDGCLGLSK